MWSYIKGLALRTMLTLASLALLTVNNPGNNPGYNPGPSTPAASTTAGVAKSTPPADLIVMTVVPQPAPESRLPRGNATLAKAAAEAASEVSALKVAADPAEIMLFQAIIAQAESIQNRSGGPARSSGGPGGGELRRAPNPDLPPEFDPNYDNWQKNADIKLNEENGRSKGKEHPLAAANPDSYLVICLGGCRASSDEIVYRVSKTAAADAVIAQRRMETTAAGAASGNKPEDLDQNAVACIAGCYANEEISPALKAKRAAAAPAARPVRVAAYVPATKALASSSLTRAHRISAETRGRIAKKRVTSVIKDTQTWRTKIAFATKKAARLAAKRDRPKRAAVTKVFRGRGATRSTIVTEASGFIF